MSWLRISLLFLLVCGGIFPAAVTGVGQVLFHDRAQGSIVYDKSGNAIGSELIAQAFDKDEYFHPRPSAAGPDGYDPTSTGGSNLGPTNQALIDRVKGSVAAAKQDSPNLHQVPADLVTTSGSGLDPDISPEAAMAQVARVAKARGMTEAALMDLVNGHVIGRDLGIFGDPRINVLKLNLALDHAKPMPASGSTPASASGSPVASRPAP
ncbi:MAG: potassium-transporting ATPase subunit KdpC [Chloroflexi bacterium]|nr:potassium-transporting ATPase subunit KdpC [Chloroflexota bacterium]